MNGDAFERGNRLWFHEGRTALALDAYAEAHRADPHDPAIALQYSTALWSVDRISEAGTVLERSVGAWPGLRGTTRTLLSRWREQLAGRPPQRYHPELPSTVLDRDELEANPQLVDNWRTVADAAYARRMYGLAAYALMRWDGAPLDGQDALELRDIAAAPAVEEARIARLLQVGRPSISEPGRRSSARLQGRGPVPAPADPSPTTEPARPAATPDLPHLPLELTVEATPAAAPTGAATTVVATLRNTSPTVQVVNRRMLLNRVGGAGEVWLEVVGPAGHRNGRGFRVRAGRATREFFVALRPGESVQQSWDLDEYLSTDTPGGYVVTLVYHNEADRSPDGRPMAVGAARGTAHLQRI